MALVCKNHPDTRARRKCFHCRAGICPPCQSKAHHHIFCSEKCAENFIKEATVQKNSSQDNNFQETLSNQLYQLDQSLNDDLREYGEIVIDGVVDEFSRHEGNLDRALTELATMIEASSTASASQSTP